MTKNPPARRKRYKMKTENYFNLKIEKEFENQIKSENIDCYFEINENGEITEDGGSFNPTTGWTNYTNWNQGWSEQDEDLNELISTLKEFQLTEAMWIEYIVSEMEYGKSIKQHTIYEGCKITLTAQDILYYDNEGEEVTPSSIEIWTENPEVKTGDEISTTDSDFEYDEGYNTFSNNEKTYWYKMIVVPTRTEYDDKEARNQGGSSGNYSYQYYEVLDIVGNGELITVDGEEVYVNIVRNWENIQEIPDEINEYILDVSEFNGTTGYIEDNNQLIQESMDDHEVMDILFESLWRYSFRYGRGGKWVRYSPEDDFSGYCYPDEIEKLTDVLAVRVFGDQNQEYLYVDETALGVTMGE